MRYSLGKGEKESPSLTLSSCGYIFYSTTSLQVHTHCLVFHCGCASPGCDFLDCFSVPGLPCHSTTHCMTHPTEMQSRSSGGRVLPGWLLVSAVGENLLMPLPSLWRPADNLWWSWAYRHMTPVSGLMFTQFFLYACLCPNLPLL